ncbi:tetratricopeptide repeat protein [Xanthomonas sp. XNM01]|uniref:tetratricopeptide repeat protein n=1 Tax=Xanthomonas sp. XNM01 TaxID=2769289 RepID=UPI00177DC7E8|nr:tetratricopeptide repeat protein [Xanthomonas sp. XNM01]
MNIQERVRRLRAHVVALPWPQWLRTRGIWLLCGVLVTLLVLLAVRRPLAELVWPDSRIQLLLDEGERALAAGRLDVADGNGARQKFEAAQALDNDRSEARDGLSRVAAAALAGAERGLEAGRLDEARRQLRLARELELPRDRIEPVERRLHRLARARIDPADAMRRADAALAAGDPDTALPLYAEVLEVEPHAIAALEGREDALSLQLERVDAALRVGQLDDAVRWLQAVRRQDPGHVGLPDAQARFAQALEQALRAAGDALRQGHAEVAARQYLALQVVAPDEAGVRQGAQRTAVVLVADALGQVQASRFEQAEQTLQLANALAPGTEGVARVGHALEEARRLQGAAAPTALDGPARARLRGALDAFARAMARDALVTPPGDSGYDHLKTAQALAPADAEVRAAALALKAAARGCVETALRDNRLRHAQACLDAWRLAAPTDPALLQARSRIAQRWLAIGEERLRAGEIEVARQTLDAARAMDPHAQGLEPFAERIARAHSGVR